MGIIKTSLQDLNLNLLTSKNPNCYLILVEMAGMLINRNVIKQWVESFIHSDERETDRHIDDLGVTSIHKREWIMYSLNIHDTIKELYPDLKVIVLIYQNCRYKDLVSVNTSLLKGVYTPPVIILYKGSLSSVLFDDAVYSDSVSRQFNMNAYVRDDFDLGDCCVFLTKEQK